MNNKVLLDRSLLNSCYMNHRYCFSCDLKDDPELIGAYKEFHAAGNVWPEITKSITESGILDMQIYLTGNRMFMIMEVDETYDFLRKTETDSQNPRVQEWENLMWKYQQALPWAKLGEKWTPMDKIFQL